MNAPPLLIAAAALFWGRQVGLLAPAAVIALVIESARFVPWRLDLSRENQYRASDICAALFGVTSLVLYLTIEPLRAVMLMLQWLPLFLAPVAAMQAYSAARKLDAGAFFWTLRKRHKEGYARRLVDVSYIYAAVCVLCASNANVRTGEYYLANILLGGWALWSVRPKSSSAAVWALLLALTAALGYQGHQRLNSMQAVVEKTALGFVYSLMHAGGKDPFQSRTAIGSIGALKRFDHIILRVRPEGGKPPPALLHNACYDLYKERSWFAREAEFQAVPAVGAGGWKLSSAKSPESVSVAISLAGGAGVLPLPAGAARIQRLPADSLRKNRLGAVKVEGGPGLADFVVRFNRKASLESAPVSADLAVPPAHGKTFARIAAELQLASKKPRERADAVARWFARGFTYSLFQGGRPLFSDPLENFLTKTRSGHCEYFASATVLLLREAGIPARYATGFSVQEFSRLENAYIVRQRHAHAWARAFVDGGWRDMDTTPPSWSDAEKSRAASLEPLRDFGSWLKFGALRALWGSAGERLRRQLVWLLLPAGLWLVWKFRKGLGRLTLNRLRGIKDAAVPVQGWDSDLYKVEKRLRAKALGRRPWEPFTAWARRVGPSLRDEAAASRLKALAALHDRYRFDPAGLGAGERETLKNGAETLLR
ncbi:MAG: transglutaminase-like domain-containing protein [Elusimicrobia bacterium]|nr:transglutaminase-like domain-containing protein [Elusimicrobiota bacterium]